MDGVCGDSMMYNGLESLIKRQGKRGADYDDISLRCYGLYFTLA